MQYRLLENPDALRRRFADTFVQPYAQFRASHAQWISRLRTEFDENYYAQMYMWDRLVPGSRVLSFAETLKLLNGRTGEVLLLTEAPVCVARDFCQLGKGIAAAADARELAACAEEEWFTEFALAEQGRYLADPVLPTDIYIFDESFRWCIILTHETDETESAESRLCLLVGEP